MATFEVGDKVRIEVGDKVRIEGHVGVWEGFEAEVVKDEGTYMPLLKPLSERPDHAKWAEFYWDRDELVLVKPEFKVGDKVRINSRDTYDPDLEPAVGREGVVKGVGSASVSVEVEGAAITAYGLTKNTWWFPRTGVALIEEEEEKVVTKFEVGEKVRLLPGARSATDSPEYCDFYASGHRVGVITGEIDEDGDYYLSGVGYVGAEFLAKFDEFPREISFEDVKVGDRISARRQSGDAFVTYEDTVDSLGTDGDIYGEAWYIDQRERWTLTLLERPEPEFTAAQVAAIGALMKAGFSEKSAEEIVKKGDSA